MQIHNASTETENGLKAKSLPNHPAHTKLIYKLQEIDHVEKGVHFYVAIF